MASELFTGALLSDDISRAIKMLGFNEPTDVQEQVIPELLNKKDIIVKSQTGSGKTAAFGIPLCELVVWDELLPQVLVLTPTRELANQVKEDLFNIGRFKRMKVVAVYGKSPFKSQVKDLKQKTHIVVGTPGRVIDHLERGTLDVSNIKYLVLDEADEMLNMGFIEQMELIMNQLPANRMTTLLSATMPNDIEKICQHYMKDPLLIEIEDQNLATDRIVQERYTVNHRSKIELLHDVAILENPDTCMIFCNTRQSVDEVYEELSKLRYTVDRLHGGLEQDDRTAIMNQFKRGKFRYLVATDVAARGIDVDNVSLVINFDIPQDKEAYIHRIGRTGRKDNEGKAITFVTPHENKFLKQIHLAIGKEITLVEGVDSDDVHSSKEAFHQKMTTKPKPKAEKGAKLNREIMKLHINAGKRTKMRAVDIVGTLCSIDGVTKDDIGIINILDVSTFVEILNNKGDLVFETLQHTPIKGRLRSVSKAHR